MSDLVTVPKEVLDLYRFMVSSFTLMTSQQEQIYISLRKAKKAMGERDSLFDQIMDKK